jgi:hypothetical protein
LQIPPSLQKTCLRKIRFGSISNSIIDFGLIQVGSIWFNLYLHLLCFHLNYLWFACCVFLSCFIILWIPVWFDIVWISI